MFWCSFVFNIFYIPEDSFFYFHKEVEMCGEFSWFRSIVIVGETSWDVVLEPTAQFDSRLDMMDGMAMLCLQKLTYTVRDLMYGKGVGGESENTVIDPLPVMCIGKFPMDLENSVSPPLVYLFFFSFHFIYLKVVFFCHINNMKICFPNFSAFNYCQ